MTIKDTCAHNLLRLSQVVKHPRHMWRLRQMKYFQSDTEYSLKQFDKTNSIFIHVPKASGVSIARSIYGNLAGGHMSMRDYELAFGPKFIQNSYIFTFVRNPWDRLYSAYRFLSKGGMNKADAKWLKENKIYMDDFECFVKKGLADPKLSQSIHIMPQARYLDSEIYGYRALKFVGFFENIEDDFQTLRANFPKIPTALAHENKTSVNQVDYRTVYTDSMRQIVAEFYQEDISLLGYDFHGESIAEQIKSRDAGSLLCKI